MDELDAASADTGVVERFVLGPLRPTHATDVRFLGGVHLDALPGSATPGPVTFTEMTANYLIYMYTSQLSVQHKLRSPLSSAHVST